MNTTEQIDKMAASLGDWRGEYFTKLRGIINSADTDIKEEVKWSTAVWTKDGLVCAIGAFKDHVKLNFFKGAKLTDPKKLINAGFDAKDHRSINFNDGDRIDEKGIKALVQEAIALNTNK
jgi:hypothetical protein